MTDKAPTAPEKQGATDEHLDDGQGTNGAPKQPGPDDTNAPVLTDEQKAAAAKAAEDAEKAKQDEADAAAAAEAEAAEKAAADEAARKEAEEALVEYVEMEDPNAQAAIDLLKEANVPVKEANAIFAKAIQSGDLNDIDVATLEAKVGKTKATLIMNGVRQYHSEQTATNEAAVNAVYEVMGGENNWNAVRDWAREAEKADPKVKTRVDGIRDMLNKGGLQAEAGGRELLRMYNADPATKGLGTSGDLTTGDGLGAQAGVPLTRADYVTELKAANARGAKAAEIAAIDARRRAGKAAGI